MRFDEIILTEKEFSGLKELNELTADGNSVFVEDSNRDILERFESLGLAEISVAQTFHPDAPRESSRRFSAPRQAKVTEKGFRYLLYCAGQEKEKAERLAKEAAEKAEQLEKEAAEKADQLAREKRERHFSLLNSLLSAAAGSLLTLFIEHFNDICLFIQSLFQGP